MNPVESYLLAFGIGAVTGLRAFSGSALVSWTAKLGWLDLHGTPLAWLQSNMAAYSLGLLAVGELVGDKLPRVPDRNSPLPLTARIVLGGLSGAALTLSHGQPALWGALLGGVGAVAGAFGGYRLRTNAVSATGAPDYVIALAEDTLTYGLGLFLVSRQ